MENSLYLGRRERQLMEIVYILGEASVSDVLDKLTDPPSYSTVRAILNILADKGHLHRKKIGKKFLYLPIVSRKKASRSALSNLLTTFFNGSATQAVASLIEMDMKNFSAEDLNRLSEIIEDAKKREK